MSARTTVATCVVLHRSASCLDRFLASLEGQTRRPDRFIFCLNGEDDGALDRLAGFGAGATVVHRPDNPGFAGGVNACLAAADTSHVLLLNPDIVLEPDYLELCMRVFDEETAVAGVCGELLRPVEDGDLEGERIDSAGFVVQPWLRIVDRASGAPDEGAFSERESVAGVCAAAAVFDREVLLRAAEDGQVMDEDFWMYKEDQDLCIRISELGHRLFFEPRARAHHDRGWRPEGRAHVPVELRRHSLKNRYLLIAKHWRWREHGWALPFLLPFEVFLFLALLGREPRTMKGYWLALRLLPRMLVKRRRILARIRHERGTDRPATPAVPFMA